MIKADLVAVMAKAAGGSKVSSEKALNAIMLGVFDSLRKGRRVTIGGFGTFMVSRRAERNGHSHSGRQGAPLQAQPHAQGRHPLALRCRASRLAP